MSKHDFCPCPSEPEIWRNAINYKSLLIADRRCFAWEWLRRTDTYRAAYRDKNLSPSAFGLLGYEDPTLATPKARPIWSPDIDAKVLASRANGKLRANGDMLDIRTLANFASVKVDEPNPSTGSSRMGTGPSASISTTERCLADLCCSSIICTDLKVQMPK